MHGCRARAAWRMLALAATFALWSSPATGATAFSVDPAELSLTLPAPAGATVAKITLANETNEAVRVALAVSSETEAGDAIFSQLVVAKGVTLSGAAKRAVPVTVSTQAGPVAPGVYSGQLVVKGTGADRKSVERVVINIDVVFPLEPTQDQLTFHATRASPFGSAAGPLDGGVPVFVPEGLRASEAVRENRASHGGNVAGTLTSDDGELTPVALTGVVEEAAGGEVLIYRLAITDVSAIGIHTGSMDLLPADPDAGHVDLRLIITDKIWWALLALAAGMGLAAPLVGRYMLGAARYLDHRMRRGYYVSGVASMALMGAGVLWSGLDVLYFDRAFGEGDDYVNAFLWGFIGLIVAWGLWARWLRLWRFMS